MSGDLVAARWRRRPAPLVISLGVLATTLAVATVLRWVGYLKTFSTPQPSAPGR